jgi:hypothetical protein
VDIAAGLSRGEGERFNEDAELRKAVDEHREEKGLEPVEWEAWHAQSPP